MMELWPVAGRASLGSLQPQLARSCCAVIEPGQEPADEKTSLPDRRAGGLPLKLGGSRLPEGGAGLPLLCALPSCHAICTPTGATGGARR